MDDQAKKILITALAVLLFLFPGIALVCFGLVSVVDSVLGFNIFASDLNTYLLFIFGGICGGILLIIVSIILIIIAFRRKKAEKHQTIIDLPPRPIEPEKPLPAEPSSQPPDEPLPPTT